MKIKEIKTIIHEYDSPSELDKEDREVVIKAREAAAHAYAPYSGFKVGACVLLENGAMFTGSNQENAAYPSGVCAERVAISSAATRYPETPVKTIAIAAISQNEPTREPIPPCGICRQVITESEFRFNSSIRIILTGREKIQIIGSAGQLLPLVFDRSFLPGK